ncbi:acyl-CoA carboxylase subunit beta [Rhodovastum atsumiense]|uniref:Acyl-CoA carboxylase subunit beta n=1 Tax=Rhodovastum atsumiense TaxID=504468 RepID=A0A5M6IMK6_9PROT|nr:acyl-CoA carboxylase subunit beta [Rhodovastum atsumiense]KAA5609514.1 acyl-CoA carboxylase subunit beta [Rhodovastum atsumiense]
MTLSAKLLEELRERSARIATAGGEDKAKARHELGQLTARERLNGLFQEGTFQEIGMHIRANPQGGVTKDFPADGVVAGTGYVDGRPVASFSQDFMVAAGTLGKMHAAKIVRAMQLAGRAGMPVVAFNDSGGARIQEAVDALSGYGEVFFQNVLLSGVVPQIAVVCGPCAGGAAYSPALMDFVVMTRNNARMFITGPEVIKAVTGRTVTMDEVGGAAMHAAVSGNVHFLAEDDAHAVSLVRRLLSYLPSNNAEDPPHRPSLDIDETPDLAIHDLIPDDPTLPMDVRPVIARLVDDGELLEVHADFAGNLIVGFARIGGFVVGLIANQSLVKAGALDIDAADKGARFIRFCNAFNIPLVTLVDVPGFLPGVEQERGGIIRHGAKMLFAYASATVPKVTVILRKAYGGSYLAMCSQEMGADFVYAWPTAEIAVMGAEGAVNVLYSKELKAAEDRRAKAAELAAAYRAEFATPYLSAGHGYITDVIDPAATRWTVVLSLRKAATKRETRPPKKHGNIPL